MKDNVVNAQRTVRRCERVACVATCENSSGWIGIVTGVGCVIDPRRLMERRWQAEKDSGCHAVVRS